MRKLYALGCILVLMNAFENSDVASGRIVERIGRINRPNNMTATFVEEASKYGYAAEERFVITADGYILSLHRIFAAPNSPRRPKKPIVLLLHGLFGSTAIWVLRGPHKDLAYLLADRGFDVWALNMRGNAYSQRNIWIQKTRPEFWRFSWHENGIYDLPAAIDYMLVQTGLQKVTLIGHSLGATMCYVLLSLQPEYNEKVDLIVSFAPPTIFTHQFRGVPFEPAAQFSKQVLSLLKRSGIHELFGSSEFTPQLLSVLCAPLGIRPICREVLFLITGSVDREQFEDELLPALFKHYPAGSSLDTMEHYLQIILNERFREFDYGAAGNLARYHSLAPPEYPVEKVTAPVALYYGLNDIFVQLPDVEALAARLPNVVALKAVPHRSFNHLDFVVSKDSKTLLYDDVVDIISKYKFTGKLKSPFG